MNSTTRRDLLANYAGRVVSVLASLAVLPSYRDLLGPERFGVVAFFTMIQSLLATLDAGLGAAFLQRISRTLGDEARRHELPDVVATFAALAAVLALVTAALVAAASPAIPPLLRVHESTSRETTIATLAMAIVLASWWPTTFFQGALLHLGRQPESNATNATFAVLRAALTYGALRWWDASLLGFSAPQACLSLAQVSFLAARVRMALPAGALGIPRAAMVRAEISTAIALGGASLLGIVITNTDRVAITALRPVADLGTYGFATLAMTAAAQVIAPVYATYYPRLCELRDPVALEQVYLEAHRAALSLALPVTLSLAAYGPTILQLWTGDVGVAAAAGQALTILSLAAAVNAPLQIVLALAYALQRAGDVARLQTVGALVFGLVCPALVWRFGIDGAASATLLFNLALAIPFSLRTHRALGTGATTRRWLETVVPTVAPIVLVTAVGAWIARATDTLSLQLATTVLGSFTTGAIGLAHLGQARAQPAR
jgi:O-antigen/teichoic acid export membrane protein